VAFKVLGIDFGMESLSPDLEHSFHLPEILPKSVSSSRLWWEITRVLVGPFTRASLIALVGAAFSAGSTLAAMQILDDRRSGVLLVLFAFFYFILTIASKAIELLSGKARTEVRLGSEAYLVQRLSRKLLDLSPRAMTGYSSGTLKVLITSDVKTVGTFLDNFVRNFIPSVAALIVVIPFLIHFTGRAGLVGVGVMAMILPVAIGLNVISVQIQKRMNTRHDTLTTLLGEWVKHVRLIRYLSWSETIRGEVRKNVLRYLSLASAQHFMACLTFGFSSSWWMFAATGVIVAGKIYNVPMDLAGFFGSLWILTFLGSYFTHLPNTIRYYGQAVPSMERIAKLLSEVEQVDSFDGQGAITSDYRPRKIIFQNVFFEYEPGKPCLKDFSLELDLRKKVAFIGEIGAGKTTLLKLILGEMPPTKGKIWIEFEPERQSDGGSRIENLWTESGHRRLRSCVSFVPQEAFISNDTIKGNLFLSDLGNDEDALSAAYFSELKTDLENLRGGISEEIGESGVNLSGGQKQRVSLARAFYSKRDYFIFDDPMSALDTHTEEVLMERLSRISEGFLLVTHRMGELSRVEEVFVLKDGCIAERGSPVALSKDPESHFSSVLRAYDEEKAE
jgi:ABC-type multidrug transport system fused ATPase/permease subunit